MTANEAAIRKAYQVAENKDVDGWVKCFTETGTFTDESIGVTYRGHELGRTVENYARAFPDMHRELYRFYEAGDTVIVELALQGTHKGPLSLPTGQCRRPANAWMHRVATSFASRTARFSRSTAIHRARSSSRSWA